MGFGLTKKSVICLILATAIAICILNPCVELASSCYGPCISGNIDKTAVNIYENVTVTGQICPVAENKSIRVAFTRPDLSYVQQWVLTDPKTGNFSVTQQLDMAGYWNIFPINGVISDRLFCIVTDPAHPDATKPPSHIPLVYTPNWVVIGATVAAISLAGFVAVKGRKIKAIKISSLRLFVQVGLVFLIFFGIFIDHQYLALPVGEISTHEELIGTNFLGISMPDGLPAPFFGCFYPCGRTVTCALWQLQTYIYPFFNTGGGWGVHYDSTGLARLAVVFGVIIFAAVLLGRFFCGWICPFGLYMDVMTRLRRILHIKRRIFSDKFNTKFHQFSYVILALIIVICVIFGSQAISGVQLVPGTEKSGFVYNYFSAPFCQVCPMKPFCILSDTSIGLMKPSWIVQTTTGQFYQLGYYITSLNIPILAIVTAAAFFFSRSWCRICPLGGLIALFNRFPPFKWISGVKLDKTKSKCNSCGVCKRICPTQVKEVYEDKDGDVMTSQCILCLRCVEMCPQEGCLKFKFVGKTVFKSRNWLNNSGTKKVEE
jgi:ferredoxin-type protein NapH